MRKLAYHIWIRTGIASYWVLHPLLALYLNKDERTRIVVWHDDKILFVKSWLDPGGWYLPGGGLHKNEDPLLGAARELEEETGIKTTSLELLGKYHFNYGMVSYDYYGFSLVLKNKPLLKLQKHEVIDVVWLTQEQALQMPLHPSFKQMIQNAKHR